MRSALVHHAHISRERAFGMMRVIPASPGHESVVNGSDRLSDEERTAVTRTQTRATSRLRELLAEPGMILAPFVFDALQAKVAEAAGFDAAIQTSGS